MKWIANTGVAAWLWQRITAIVVFSYVVTLSVLLLPYALGDAALSFATWQTFFSGGMRLFGGIALLMLLLHGWIGMWIVITDYIPPQLRWVCVSLLSACLVLLFVWFVYATQ